MKETAVVMPVYKCSGCSYTSLQRPPVSKHIDAKCQGASLIKEDKLVRHRDLSAESDDIATLHQCSNCGYTSHQPTHVKTHLASKCQGATMLSGKRRLTYEEVPKTHKTHNQGNVTAVLGINGDNNAPINQYNIMLVISANTPEEFQERLKIFYQVSKENGITFEQGEFMPSVLLKGFEKTNPGLDNKVCNNNSVVCLKTGKSTPLMKYAKIELANIMNLMTKMIETYEPTNKNEEKFISDLIGICIHPDQVKATKYYIKQKRGEDKVNDVSVLRHEIQRLLHKDEMREKTLFYSALYMLSLDLLSYRMCDKDVPEDVQQKVRIMLKDIASHIKAKKTDKGRPTNTIAVPQIPVPDHTVS